MQIDHVALGAINLQQAAEELGREWGVDIPFGGRHDAMGTHNCIARCGDASYLEIIAADPAAVAPQRRRWFTLDDPKTRARLALGPRPLTWVVAVDDLDRLLADSPLELGEALPMRRDSLHWRISVPGDGGLPGDGLLPAFIEWPEGPHPASRMANPGLRLLGVKLEHPSASQILGWLRALGVDHLASVEAAAEPRLVFEIATPRGTIRC